MYSGLPVYDIHSHIRRPPLANSFAATLLSSNSDQVHPLSPGSRPLIAPEMYEQAAAEHIAYLDERNIDVQLLGPQPFLMFGWMPKHLLPTWTRYINDAIHLHTQLYPDRFIGACQLPQLASAPDTKHCLSELDRCVNELGFKAVYVSPDPTGNRDSPGLADVYWYPLYERCQELGLPIIIHGSACQDPRISMIPENYQIGFVIEQYIATQIYSYSNVFADFPGLKVVVCHCGGALERFPSRDLRYPRDPSENLFFDTCAYDIDYLAAAIKTRGSKRMLLGTEARGAAAGARPGRGGRTEQRGAGEPGISSDDLVPVIASYDFLSEDEKIGILNANPLKVLPAFAEV